MLVGATKIDSFDIFSLSLSGNYSQTTNDAIQEAINAGINFAIAGKFHFES